MEPKETITWVAPEYRHYQKTIGWYITLVAVSVLVVGFFVVIQKDYFAAVTTAILALLVAFFATQHPQMVEVTLSKKGLHFGNIFYPYKQIKHFWVVHNRHHKTLNIITTTYMNNVVIVELEDQDPETIREFLIEHLPEHTETEATRIQKITHHMKF